MSKFNRGAVIPTGRSFVRNTTSHREPVHTFEGGRGHARDARSELWLLAITNMVGERTYYETGPERDARYRELVRALALEDPAWLVGMIGWLRGTANMRTAAVVAAAEMANARADAGEHGHTRQAVRAALQRADEPGELLGYWFGRYGRRLPIALKRGLADAVLNLYTERSLLKYDNPTNPIRFGDVIELAQPRTHHRSIRGTWREDLYRYAIERRHNRDNPIPERLETIQRRADLAACPVDRRHGLLTSTTGAITLHKAGMTWESVAAWLQSPMDAAAWEAVIPTMRLMALTRNLRNFDQAGISDQMTDHVCRVLADPDQVRRSRMFPFRFLAAHRAVASLRWGHALERALTHSLANVPSLPGRSLILVDRSVSMFGGVSERSGLNRADTAALFGTALAMRAEQADLVQFGTHHAPVTVERGAALLRVVDRFDRLGGTDTSRAVAENYHGHDRVILLTDEQAAPAHAVLTAYSYRRTGDDPLAPIPASVPTYTWNLAGYEHGHSASGEANRHVFGGLGDAAFRAVPLLEAGHDAAWPWLSDTTANAA